MKDLRSELIDRLEAIASERTRLAERNSELETIEQAIRIMLAEESRRFTAPAQLPLSIHKGLRSTTPLGRFIRSALSDNALSTVAELAEQAIQQGIDFSGKNAKRSIHFALLGMASGGYVKKNPEGRWYLTAKGRGEEEIAENQ